MKRLILFCLLLSSSTLIAQVTNESFDTYSVGTFDGQWNPNDWTGWFGFASNTSIDSTQARSLPHSMLVNSSGDDVVALLGTLDDGTYEVVLHQYIGTGFGGYYNLQHNYTNAAGDWALEVYIGDTSVTFGRIVTDAMTATFIPVYDQWVENKFVFNFEIDEAEFYYNGSLVHTWTISTSALGGQATNEINAINFFGSCDGFNCVTQAYYDDITVVQTVLPTQYDASILTKPEPITYTQIPDSLMTPMTLSAEVINYGQMPVTNIQVTFDVFDENDNLVHTEQSNILSVLGSNATDIVTGTGAYIPLNQSEQYTIAYDVNIAEIDENPQNNLDTLLYDIIVTDSIYAKDDGNYTTEIGANGLTAIIGQTFEFVEKTNVHSVEISYVGGLAGDDIRLVIYKTDSLTRLPTDDIYASAIYTLTSAGNGIGNDQFLTFYMTIPIGLDVGLYTFAIEQMTTNSIGISASTSIFIPETTLSSTNNGVSWAFLENFGFEVAMNIRPNVSIRNSTQTLSIKNIELLEIAPNPTNGLFQLNIELSEQLPIQIDILNTKGQLVKTIQKNNIKTLQLPIDLTNQSTGLYVIRLSIGNEIITKQVLKK